MDRSFEKQIGAYEDLQDKFSGFANERLTDRGSWEGRSFYVSTSPEDKNEHVAKMDFYFYAYFYKSILDSVDTYSGRIVVNQERIPGMHVGADVAKLLEPFKVGINNVYDISENIASELLLTLIHDKEFPNNIYDKKMRVDRELYDEIVQSLKLIKDALKRVADLNVGAGITHLPFQYERSENLVCFNNFLVDPIDKVSVEFSTNFKDFVKANRHFARMGSLFESYEKGFKHVIDVLEIAQINENILLVDDASPHVFLQALILIIKHVHEVRVNSFISRCMLDKSL
jgi:hypothetical protein